MGNINVIIDDALEKQVRVRIAKSGGKRGALTNAIEEGLRLWLKQPKSEPSAQE